MGAKNFYDAVLVGLTLPTLLAGGLLAKRGFRVLVVAQGLPLPSYQIDSLRFPRSPFTLTAADSPAVARVLSELALKHLVQRRIKPLSPAFQAVLPQHRLDFHADPERVSREFEREFPSVRRSADDYMRSSQRTWEDLNLLVGRDLTWPPLGFFERREFARASFQHPFRRPDLAHPLGELPDDHPFLRLVHAVLRFADGSEVTDQHPERTLRLFGSWLHAAELSDGGLSALFELLIDNIRAHNGEVRLHDRVERVMIKRRSMEGVRLSPSDEEVGCHFVLSGIPVHRLGRLLSDRSELDAMLDEYGQPRPRYFRYTLNLLVAATALPEGMGRNVFLLQDGTSFDKEHALRLEADLLPDGKRALLTVEALLRPQAPELQEEELASMRERILDALDSLSPFIRSHLELVDSPHDGRGIFRVATGSYETPEASWTRGPETMPVVYEFPRTDIHGTCALPGRTPIKRLLLCNEQVVPGLGLEGNFIAAWSAARTVTRSLNREWMNRGRWTKVDL